MLDRAGVAPERRRFERSIDARYERQSYELSIPVPARALDQAALSEIADAFHDRHRQTYGHDNRSEPVQLVSIRVAAIGAIPPLPIRDKTGGRRHQRRQSAAAGVVPRNRRGRRHDLRSRPHAGRAGGAGAGGDRVAGVDHSCPAGLAG